MVGRRWTTLTGALALVPVTFFISDDVRAEGTYPVLQEALDAAGNYARSNDGVGIVIHVGQDFPNDVFETPEEYAEALIMLFDRDHQAQAQAFLTPNPQSPGSGVTYYIADMVHGYGSGKSVKGTSEAVYVMEDVVAQMRRAHDKATVIGGAIGSLTDEQVQGVVSTIEQDLNK